jgi:hypothetical protein
MSLLKFDEVAFRKVQYRNKYTKRSMIFFFILAISISISRHVKRFFENGSS